jgi:hypothetical protein
MISEFVSRFLPPAGMAMTLSTLLQKTVSSFAHQRCSIMIACGALAVLVFPLLERMPTLYLSPQLPLYL